MSFPFDGEITDMFVGVDAEKQKKADRLRHVAPDSIEAARLDSQLVVSKFMRRLGFVFAMLALFLYNMHKDWGWPRSPSDILFACMLICCLLAMHWLNAVHLTHVEMPYYVRYGESRGPRMSRSAVERGHALSHISSMTTIGCLITGVFAIIYTGDLTDARVCLMGALAFWSSVLLA